MDDDTLQFRINRYVEKYLEPLGWTNSVRADAPVDAQGDPIPWLTYPAIRALERIVKPGMKVFEFGTGYSTLWWSHHVAEVVGVEHSAEWVQKVRDRCPSNVDLRHVAIDAPLEDRFQPLIDPFFEQGLEPEEGEDYAWSLHNGFLTRPFLAYASELLRFPSGYFDVIVVDGMARVLTAWLAAQRIKEAGFILFDNSDKAEYRVGYDVLRQAGFTRIDYWGSGPINNIEFCTSIFTKTLSIFH